MKHLIRMLALVLALALLPLSMIGAAAAEEPVTITMWGSDRENMPFRNGLMTIDMLQEKLGIKIDIISAPTENLAEKYGKDVYVVVGNMSVILQRPDFLSRTRLFILNEIEAGCLFDCDVDSSKPEEVLQIAREEALVRGIREIVVTLGEHGSVFFDSQSGDSGHIPAEPTRMVDSTGAGDAFFSGTVAARTKGLSLRKSAQLGAHLAALTIQSDESSCPRVESFLNG